ncbi:hypothetical protein HG535_0A08750 [Zygotorulaspora mrakii]|uniref:Autophagy-related protein 33 n=1 Tax=Zygotorulaspora mrakii TaxID=42260 RepID=A0A7H9AWY5_ZYGMR|nr:uncharacterized protein HG535_0A08750 [Zygotorulaspora mrakii]QLG70928.1 hypothetical protein HG535_0A08750 [Zygotorulaspora mrakii]
MSVCLAVTKGIAVSSLGLYAGILTTTSLVTIVTPLEVLSQHLSPVVCKIGELASFLGTLSTGFFAASFFAAPPHLRHPYLLYGALVAPVSALYLWGISRCNHKIKYNQKKREEQSKSPQGPQLSDSVVDLGKENKCDAPAGHPPINNDGAKCPFGSATVTHCPPSADAHRPKRCQKKINCHLAVVTLATVAGFISSVVGIYGEGQLA